MRHGSCAINIIDVLLAFSQLALGLAGFAAILVALSGSPSQWTAVDAFRIKNMLAFSFAGIFLALVPVLLTFFTVPEPELWKTSLLVLATFTFGGALFALAGVRRLSVPERAVLRGPLVVIVLSILLTAASIEAIMAFGSATAAPGVFFAGLLVMLGMAVYLVVRFLFARTPA
ncbi:MAG TPA: hypothetical protein VIS57_06920 [Xanthomonadales bacterium]